MNPKQTFLFIFVLAVLACRVFAAFPDPKDLPRPNQPARRYDHGRWHGSDDAGAMAHSAAMRSKPSWNIMNWATRRRRPAT